MSNTDFALTYKRDGDKHPLFIAQGVKDFNAAHIFDCGQCFRWRSREDGSYTGIAGSRMANVHWDGGILRITELAGESHPEDFDEFWRNYLDLSRDYGSIKRKLSRGDLVMKEAVKYGSGIRILKQDLWETIISFIISQNNNIPRIKGCIEKLAENFGRPLKQGGNTGRLKPEDVPEDLALFTLPTPERLASLTEKDLAPVRLGYRAEYLIKTALAVCEKGLPENMEELGCLTGVGPKVANCIALFGMGKMESFPIDVWVKRIMHDTYGFDESDLKGMAEFAEKRFGNLGGIAQQYLFYYVREKAGE